jgi:hypothetical protein
MALAPAAAMELQISWELVQLGISAGLAQPDPGLKRIAVLPKPKNMLSPSLS